MSRIDPENALTKTQSELIACIFDSEFGSFSIQFSRWIKASTRFTRFADKFKDKIRKKIRVTKGFTSQTDLFHELQIAFWLLGNERFELDYEPYAAGKTRGPDFGVIFRRNFAFDVEVTHAENLSIKQSGDKLMDYRLADVICRKLPQLKASKANVLIVTTGALTLGSLDLPFHLAMIKSKAEQSEPAFYARYDFSGPPDFFKHFSALGCCSLV